MDTAWVQFVGGVIQGEPDDPFVHLLLQRLHAGYTVVRINFTTTPKGPVYVLLLSHLRQLSKMEVPHSASFTRWSLAAGMRMASREEEEERWALLAAERFQLIADDVGADYARLILLECLRVLAPPRTGRALALERATRTAPGREQSRAIRQVDAFLGSLAGDLGGALRYPAEEAADLLDGALERLVGAPGQPARLAARAAKQTAMAARGGARR